MKKKSTESLEDRLLRIDWPNTRDGNKWKKTSPAFKRLKHYGKQLLKVGMTQDEIANMFADLYWDSSEECSGIQNRELEKSRFTRSIPYYDEHDIMFRLDAANLTAEDLKRDFEFYGNAYAKSGLIYLTHSRGGAGGHELHGFLGLIRLDRCYAFGPTKKQSGWPPDKLAEVGAVGVYRRKTSKARR